MRLKMALICALPYRPTLLILDEGFSGLDPLVPDEFMEGLLLQAGEMTIFQWSKRETPGFDNYRLDTVQPEYSKGRTNSAERKKNDPGLRRQ